MFTSPYEADNSPTWHPPATQAELVTEEPPALPTSPPSVSSFTSIWTVNTNTHSLDTSADAVKKFVYFLIQWDTLTEEEKSAWETTFILMYEHKKLNEELISFYRDAHTSSYEFIESSESAIEYSYLKLSQLLQKIQLAQFNKTALTQKNIDKLTVSITDKSLKLIGYILIALSIIGFNVLFGGLVWNGIMLLAIFIDLARRTYRVESIRNWFKLLFQRISNKETRVAALKQIFDLFCYLLQECKIKINSLYSFFKSLFTAPVTENKQSFSEWFDSLKSDFKKFISIITPDTYTYISFTKGDHNEMKNYLLTKKNNSVALTKSIIFEEKLGEWYCHTIWNSSGELQNSFKLTDKQSDALIKHLKEKIDFQEMTSLSQLQKLLFIELIEQNKKTWLGKSFASYVEDAGFFKVITKIAKQVPTFLDAFFNYLNHLGKIINEIWIIDFIINCYNFIVSSIEKPFSMDSFRDKIVDFVFDVISLIGKLLRLLLRLEIIKFFARKALNLLIASTMSAIFLCIFIMRTCYALGIAVATYQNTCEDLEIEQENLKNCTLLSVALTQDSTTFKNNLHTFFKNRPDESIDSSSSQQHSSEFSNEKNLRNQSPQKSIATPALSSPALNGLRKRMQKQKTNSFFAFSNNKEKKDTHNHSIAPSNEMSNEKFKKSD